MLTSGGIAGFSTIKVKKVLKIIAACPERRRPGKASAADLPTAWPQPQAATMSAPTGQQGAWQRGSVLVPWALPSFWGRSTSRS
jgi:hypothetical protein